MLRDNRVQDTRFVRWLGGRQEVRVLVPKCLSASYRVDCFWFLRNVDMKATTKKKVNKAAAIREFLEGIPKGLSKEQFDEQTTPVVIAKWIKEKHGVDVPHPYISVRKWLWVTGGEGAEKKDRPAKQPKAKNGHYPRHLSEFVLASGGFDAAKKRLESQKEKLLIDVVSECNGARGALSAIEKMEKEYASMV